MELNKTNTKEHISIFLSKSPEEMKKILTSNNIFDVKDIYEFLSIRYAGNPHSPRGECNRNGYGRKPTELNISLIN